MFLETPFAFFARFPEPEVDDNLDRQTVRELVVLAALPEPVSHLPAHASSSRALLEMRLFLQG